MLLRAIIVGLLYWQGMSRANFLICMVFRSPVILGVLIGALYGKVQEGLVLGAAINMMSLGGIVAGGNITKDTALSSCIVIPIALQSNLDINAAAALSVPLGSLGVYLNSIRKTVNTYWGNQTDKAIEERNYKKANFCNFMGPYLGSLPILFLPVFLGNLIGINVLSGLVEKIPPLLMNGLSVAGSALPAVGIATSLVLMGKREYLPYFFLSYYLTVITGMSTLVAVILGICSALIIGSVSAKNQEA